MTDNINPTLNHTLSKIELKLNDIDVKLNSSVLKLDEIEQKMATKDDIKRLKDKIKETSSINVRHHIETKADIGHINRQLSELSSTKV